MIKATKGTIIFGITYTVLTAVALISIFLGLGYLRNVLADFEQHLPEKVAEQYIEELSGGDYSSLFENVSFSPSPFEDADVFRKTYLSLLTDDFSFSKASKESTETAPVYRIKSGTEEVAKLYLKPLPEKSEFGFYIFEVEKVTLNDLETHSVTITAPSIVEVFLNGKKVDDSYVTAKTEDFPEAEYFHQYLLSTPQMITYEIGGLLDTVEITAKDMFGKSLAVNPDNTVPIPVSNDVALVNRAIDFCTTYSEYTLNDNTFAAVAEFIAPDVPLYSRLRDYVLQYIGWHTGYEFLNVTATDLIFYSPTCFSINIKYDHLLNSYEDVILPIDYRVYFTIIEDNVLATDLLMR